MDPTKIIPQIQKVVQWKPQHEIHTKNTQYTLQLPTAEQRIIDVAKNIFPLLTVNSKEEGLFYLFPAESNPGDVEQVLWEKYDAYSLRINSNGVYLCAATARGFFYGINTIKKLQTKAKAKDCLPFCELKDWADVSVRCDYLEFRNFHPQFGHLPQYLEQMAQRHINAVIIELEDKRPFPSYPFLTKKETEFSQQQIDELREIAHRNFIELIPLQQSFGHLEYVLRHPQYQHLRELPESPGELCPSNPASADLAISLLQDITSIFPESKYLHIGCDEVWSLGKCQTCKKQGLTNTQLVIRYVNQLIEAVCAMGKTPLLWHDMLIECTEQELKELDKRVIVVLWMYDGNDVMFRASRMLELLQKNGIRVWGGCAVRCWDQSGLQNYPLLKNRQNNIMYWQQLADKYSLEGMVNTNWSAYSALACPYGVYETSVYPSFFAAEHLWNRHADEETFLARFLQQYHGVTDVSILQEGWKFEDYFGILPRLRPMLKQAETLGELMEAVDLYERAAEREFPAYLQLFRVRLYPNEEAEWESLLGRYQSTFQLLRQAKPPLEKALRYFLDDASTAAYVASRYNLWELLEKEILNLALQHGKKDFSAILTAQTEDKE